jgi:hypothetical protein
MRNYAIALVFSLLSMMVVGCGTSDPADGFVGAYQNTITISGSSSVTANDALSISNGSSSDLVFQSQQLGALKVSITGHTSFSIDQQQIMLNGPNGPFSVTIQGQGTVVDHVFSASGTMSSNTGSLAFTWNGQKL